MIFQRWWSLLNIAAQLLEVTVTITKPNKALMYKYICLLVWV